MKRQANHGFSSAGIARKPWKTWMSLIRRGTDSVCTPKELRLTAQGCERSELPWVTGRIDIYPNGVASGRLDDATPLG